MAHNESIIQWMLAVIIGFSAFLVFRSIFGKKTVSDGHAGAGASEDVQNLLKKVLDQTTILEKAMMTAPTAVMPAMTSMPAAPAEGAVPAAASDPAEVAKLKKLIADRDEELERLKNDPMAGKLRDQIAKVQELQNRLKEYEILEDDIADLSLYKEENARLKAELQNMVSGGAAAAPAPVAVGTVNAVPQGPPAGNAVAGSDALVDQFAQVVDQTKGLESSAVAAEGVSHLPQTGDPMADFASAVQIEKTAAADAPAPTEPPTATPVPPVEISPMDVAPVEAPPTLAVVPSSPVAEPPVVTADSNQANDLFAEFSSGSLDTDKVMEELVSLEKLPAADGKEALEGDLDADKMVAEAAGFSKN